MSHSSSGVAARSSTPNHCRARQRAMAQRVATAVRRKVHSAPVRIAWRAACRRTQQIAHSVPTCCGGRPPQPPLTARLLAGTQSSYPAHRQDKHGPLARPFFTWQRGKPSPPFDRPPPAPAVPSATLTRLLDGTRLDQLRGAQQLQPCQGLAVWAQRQLGGQEDLRAYVHGRASRSRAGRAWHADRALHFSPGITELAP